MSKWDKVTAKDYFEKKKKVLDSLGRSGKYCESVCCNECPLYHVLVENKKEINCGELELEYTEKVIETVMEYKIPVDWSKVPVDTKILVRDSDREEWKPRYFAKFENGRVFAFPGGSTSFSVNSELTCWGFAKLYKGE